MSKAWRRLKKVGKAIKKTVAKVAKIAMPIASALGVPGVGAIGMISRSAFKVVKTAKSTYSRARQSVDTVVTDLEREGAPVFKKLRDTSGQVVQEYKVKRASRKGAGILGRSIV